MSAKLHPVALFFAVSFLVPLGEAVIFRRVEPMGSGALVQMFLSAFAVYWWYHLDKVERAFRAGALQNIAVAFITVIGLPVYLFRSRGFSRGAIATLIAIVAMLAGAAATYLGMVVGYKIAF